MAYILGIDVGSQLTSAAVIDAGSDARNGRVLDLAESRQTVPSVVFVGRGDERLMVGDAAEAAGAAEPGRLLRDITSRVGDAVPMIIDDLQFTAERLFASIALWVEERAAELEGSEAEAVVIVHPAHWGPHRIGSLRTALAGVGLSDASLVPKVTVADGGWAGHSTADPFVVLDLGAETLEVTILTRSPSGDLSISSTQVAAFGGADFDQAVFEHVRASTNDFEGIDLSDSVTSQALRAVRRACVEAKEALSFDAEVTIPVQLPGLTTEVRLVRSEFESLIEDTVREAVDVVTTALSDAGVAAASAQVLVIGGSGRVPLVAQLLSEGLDRPITVATDPQFASVLSSVVAEARHREIDLAARFVPVVDSAPPTASAIRRLPDVAAAFRTLAPVRTLVAHPRPVLSLVAAVALLSGSIVVVAASTRTGGAGASASDGASMEKRAANTSIHSSAFAAVAAGAAPHAAPWESPAAPRGSVTPGSSAPPTADSPLAALRVPTDQAASVAPLLPVADPRPSDNPLSENDPVATPPTDSSPTETPPTETPPTETPGETPAAGGIPDPQTVDTPDTDPPPDQPGTDSPVRTAV